MLPQIKLKDEILSCGVTDGGAIASTVAQSSDNELPMQILRVNSVTWRLPMNAFLASLPARRTARHYFDIS